MIAILGGGISGITAAYELLKANKDFILLEASDQLGGKIKTIQKEDFILETGPNTVLVNNEETASLLKELSLWDKLVFPDDEAAKSRFILKNGKPEPIPNSFSSAFKSKLFRFSTLGSILKEPFLKKNENSSEESLAEFSRRRFGSSIYEDFILPFVTGIYAGDPEKMSIDYTLNILKEAEQKHGSVLKGMVKIMKEKKAANAHLDLPKQKIFTFKTGLKALVDAIYSKISQSVSLQSSVTEINKNSEGYEVSYEKDGFVQSIQVNTVVASLPAPALSKICGKISPSFSGALSDINYVPAVVNHYSVSTEHIGFKHKAFGILSRKQEDVPFLGILFSSRFFPHTAKEGKELITVISGGTKNPEMVHKTETEIDAAITPYLKKILSIQETPRLLHLQKWKKGIPQYELGYHKIDHAIKDFMKENRGFYIAANFYEGISVSDCIKNGTILGKKLSS